MPVLADAQPTLPERLQRYTCPKLELWMLVWQSFWKCQGTSVTLRPWHASSCILAAVISNHLIHLPIRPARNVLALGCSLETLSHIADIAESLGDIIGLFDLTYGVKPTSQRLRKMFRLHPPYCFY